MRLMRSRRASAGDTGGAWRGRRRLRAEPGERRSPGRSLAVGVLSSIHRRQGMTAGETATLSGERADLAETLGTHRSFLRYTVRGLTDEQAAQRTTASELTLGGLIKHVLATEKQWADFIVNGPAAMGSWDGEDTDAAASWAGGFQMAPGETLAGLIAG